MIKLLRLQATYRLLTPAWLGNADQNAELRTAPLKGLLRFWFRAAEPQYRLPATSAPSATPRGSGLSREEWLFGTAGERGGIGLGSFSLQPPSERPRLIRWEDVKAARFDEGSGRNTRNGLLYLGFSLKMNALRTALPAGLSFTLQWDLRPTEELFRDRPTTRRALRGLLAAFWLLGTLGGMGTRSRRGFGALALERWQITDRVAELVPDGSPLSRFVGGGSRTRQDDDLDRLLSAWEEDRLKLPLLDRAPDVQSWTSGLHAGRSQLTRWFPANTPELEAETRRIPSLGAAFQAKLLPKPHTTWEPCLNQLGQAFQTFRLRRQPDYDQVKAHARFVMGDRGGSRLRKAPERVVFGLPLTFRFTSLPGAKPVQLYSFNGKSNRANDRHPSLLLLRPVQLKSGLHGLVVRLDGPVPGITPEATFSTENAKLSPPSGGLLSDFMRSLGDT